MGTIDFRSGRVSIPSFQTIATVLAVLIPLVGLAGAGGAFLLGFGSMALLAIYVAVPSILAPVLYLYATGTEVEFVERNRHVDGLLLAGYFALQGVAVLLLATNEVRPHSYYATIAALAVVVLLQILRFSPERRRVWPILGQIVLLHLNLVWGVTLKYHYFIGRTDVFGHVRLVRVLLEKGFLTPAFGQPYEAFPLWHVLGAMEHLMFGGQVAPRVTLFVLSGVVYAFVPVGVYLVARRLFDSPRIALAAGLLTALNATVTFYGMYAISRSIASFLFVVLVLTWVRGDGRSVLLFGAFTVAIAAYHTVSLPFVFVILAVYYGFGTVSEWIGDGLGSRGIRPTYLLLGLIVVVQAVYWLNFAEYLLEHLVSVVFRQSPPGQINSGILAQPLRELANYVHHSALLVFVFVGTLAGLASDRVGGPAKAAVLSALVLTAVSFPGPHLLVGTIAESFNVLRFYQYAFPFITITAAYGIVALMRRGDRSKATRRTITVVVLVLFLIFSLATVSNDFVASDNPAVERQFYTTYLSEAEERSMRTVAAIGAGNVSSDYVGTRYYEASPYADKARILGVSEDRGRLYFGPEPDLVFVRERELQRRPLQLWVTDEYRGDAGYLAALGYVERDAGAWSGLDVSNRVYDSEAASAYQRPAVTAGNRTSVTDSSETVTPPDTYRFERGTPRSLEE